ncbi:hypothetical protein JCM24511_00741 [Saitozyma sp. JCM 24511]|nr:hypothetical protein JCM24511_00741 [Saitozyma sp. JCM 24511]
MSQRESEDMATQAAFDEASPPSPDLEKDVDRKDAGFVVGWEGKSDPVFNLPVAFANNIAVHLIFRFLTGFAGSAFLSVSGGAVSDVFPNHLSDDGMVGCAFYRPNPRPFGVRLYQPEHELALGVLRYHYLGGHHDGSSSPVRSRNVQPLAPPTSSSQTEKGDRRHQMDRPGRNDRTTHWWGTPKELQDTLYTVEQSGLCFLGIGLGQVLAVLSQPLFHRHYRQIAARSTDGIAPPESRLIPGFFGVIACPLGLLLLGLLSFDNVPWILPILGSLFFGVGMVYSFTSTFTYLVDAYRPVAASALASNSFLRSAFAAGFPLFGHQLYVRLGAVGGTCLLAGLMALTIPLPFVFYRIGARVRERSPFSL